MSNENSVKVVVVTGPTATGKTALAVELARRFDGEIVSADSRQVYRGLDLGTGKDLAEYGEIPYHLIDVVEPTGDYHLAAFLPDCYRAVGDIAARGKLPVVCGGSALYVAALLQNYRLPGGAFPSRASGLPRVRAEADGPGFEPPFPIEFLTLGVYFPRAVVRDRIERRLDARLDAGMADEVRRLHDERGVSWQKLEFLGLEYRELALYWQGKCDFAEMRSTLLNRIRQFAKRQDIFFRKMEREGVRIDWLREGNREQAVARVGGFLRGDALPPPDFQLKDIVYGPRSR